MVRNEIDIIRLFLKHIDSLFDQVYIVDHHSVDGTTALLNEAVEQRPSWKYYRLDIIANLQQKVTNCMITKAFQEGADFVFILDADEYIYIQNRSALEEVLKGIQGSNHVGLFSWINCLPEVTASFAEINEQTPLLQSPSVSKFSKVVIPRSCFEKDTEIYNSLGSHETYWGNGKKIPGILLGNIIHIPIRSEEQAIRKAILMKVALLMKYDRDELKSNNNYQYRYFLRQIAIGEMNRLVLMHFVHIYEDADYVDDGLEKVNTYWADALHTSLLHLRISFSEKLSLVSQSVPVEISALIADTLNLGYRIYYHSADVRFDGDHLTRVQKELIESDLDWNIQRDHLLSKVETLKQKDECTSEELSRLQYELALQKSRESFYINSRSRRITRPLRRIRAVFLGKKEADSDGDVD
jgi:hypothetical protein